MPSPAEVAATPQPVAVAPPRPPSQTPLRLPLPPRASAEPASIAAAAGPSAAAVVQTIQPTYPSAQPREVPKVWTFELAWEHVDRDAKNGVTRISAHSFLSEWRDGGSFPDRHVEDLTNSLEFDWLAYLAVHPSQRLIFGEVGVVRFEIRYLMPRDSNTNNLRCDFVAYWPDGTAIRLHPSSAREAIPVVVANMRTIAADWTLSDPLPRPSERSVAYGCGVYLNVSDHDGLSGKIVGRWLEAEARSGRPLRDITERLPGAQWFPWPLLVASVKPLNFLIQTGVAAVALCRLRQGTLGITIRQANDGSVVVVAMNGSRTSVKVLLGRKAHEEVSCVASGDWAASLMDESSASRQLPSRHREELVWV